MVRVPSAGKATPYSAQLSEADLRMDAEQGVVVMLLMSGHGLSVSTNHHSALNVKLPAMRS